MKRLPLLKPPQVDLVRLDANRSVYVVRDDLLAGGTKMRGLKALFASKPEVREWVYGSPTCGYAQVALAIGAYAYGKKVTIFVPQRGVNGLGPYSRLAASYGANIIPVPMGFQSNINAKARQYVEGHCGLLNARRGSWGGALVPFGVRCPAMIDSIAEAARQLPIVPEEVWTVLSSGTLSGALQKAWPKAKVYGVQIGHKPTAEERGRAELLKAPEPFAAAARIPPPFPSCENYDAKAWRFIVERASDGALFWNVAAGA